MRFYTLVLNRDISDERDMTMQKAATPTARTSFEDARRDIEAIHFDEEGNEKVRLILGTTFDTSRLIIRIIQTDNRGRPVKCWTRRPEDGVWVEGDSLDPDARGEAVRHRFTPGDKITWARRRSRGRAKQDLQ